MNWLVDTQLPHQLTTALKQRGHRAMHASDLPQSHHTPDEAIIAHADREEAVVVTKDADFIAAYEVKGQPKRLPYTILNHKSVRSACPFSAWLLRVSRSVATATQRLPRIALRKNGCASLA